VGTGPFKFAEWLRSPRLDILGVRLERNNAYFGRQAYLAALEYSPYFTEDQFEEGSVHLVSVTSERMLRKRYRSWRTTPQVLRPGLQLRHFARPP
jgi:MarR-like DNA-binding transcriptional regulator SgrR of sgrS sRNA